MQLVVAISFILLALVTAYFLNRMRNSKIEKVHRSFADKYGLNFTFDKFMFKRRPEISGEYEGRKIRIEMSSNKSINQKDKYYFSVATVDFPDFEPAFALCKKSMFNRYRLKTKLKNIQVDTRALSDEYDFYCDNENNFKVKLSPEIIELLSANIFGEHILYDNGQFHCKGKKVITSEKKMAEMKNMLDICIAFSKQ